MSVADEIRGYLEDELAQSGTAVSLDDSAPLIGTVFDSLGLLNLVVFIEERFDIVVDDPEITVNNFRTIENLASFVNGKSSTLPAGGNLT